MIPWLFIECVGITTTNITATTAEAKIFFIWNQLGREWGSVMVATFLPNLSRQIGTVSSTHNNNASHITLQ